MKLLTLRYILWWILVLSLVCFFGVLTGIIGLMDRKKAPIIYQYLCLYMYRVTCYVLPIEITGMDVLEENIPYIVTANHQSFSDTPLMMALLGGFKHYPRFVMKDTIRYIPILNLYAYYLKFIYLNRKSPRDALKRIRQAATDHTVIQDITLFPEGTRAPFGKIYPSKIAGLYWISQSFPDHAWVDITIIYHTNGIKVTATQMPKCSNKKDLEIALQKQLNHKIASGLTLLAPKNEGNEL